MAETTASGKLIHRNSSVSKESDHVAVKIRPGTVESSTPDRLSESICIYKVPDHLRKSNEKSYTPQVISIRPIHHGNKKLQTMENYKVKYLNDFVLRAQTSLEDLVRIVKDSEEMVRECYAEDIELINSDDFVNMILHDAAFIIEYFLRDRFPKQWTAEDKIVIKPWQTARMQLDFLLLENQLPFFIIEKLHELLLVSDTINYPPFIEVTFSYFSFLNTQDHSYSYRSEFRIIKHFVDLLRSFYLPLQGRDLVFEKQGRVSERKYGNDHYVEEMYSASQLAEAGLIFKKSASRCQLDLRFQNGVLEIPGLTLDKDTELYARNLMALEQLHYPREAYITDYFRFLDFLIDTGKDVDLLGRKKILVNRLGDNCATIVNNLCSNDVNADTRVVYYYELCQDLVDFYNNPWNSWKMKLRRDLSTPWIIVTTTSAIFLLVLTLVQTVCTVISTIK